MKVCGRSSMTRFEAMTPSAARPAKRARNGANRCATAIAWTAMKPMLCRLRAWRAPGLPSPAITSIGAPYGRRLGEGSLKPKPYSIGEADYFLPADLAAAAGAAAALAASAVGAAGAAVVAAAAAGAGA